MAIALVLRERLRRANHLNLMREGWESWLFWYTLIQDCLTLCTCFFPVHECLHLFFFWNRTPSFKKNRWPVQGLKLMEKFLPLLLRLQKRKLLGETGLFCTSSSLLAIWFRCSVLSFYLACHAKFSFKSDL